MVASVRALFKSSRAPIISLTGKGNVVASSQFANSASIFLRRPSLYKGVTGHYYNDGFFEWQKGRLGVTRHNGTSIRPRSKSELLTTHYGSRHEAKYIVVR